MVNKAESESTSLSTETSLDEDDLHIAATTNAR